jgi:hypothetical protein
VPARAVAVVGPGGHRESVLHVVGVCRLDGGHLLGALAARVTLGDEVFRHFPHAFPAVGWSRFVGMSNTSSALTGSRSGW